MLMMVMMMMMIRNLWGRWWSGNQGGLVCKNRPRMIYNLATTDPLIIIIIIIIYGEGGDDDDGQMQAVDVSM